VAVLKLGTDEVSGFILEGVSVDLGRTMLPVIDILLVRPTPQVLFAWRRFVFAPIRRSYREDVLIRPASSCDLGGS